MKIYLDTSAFFYFFFENKEYSRGIKKIFDKIVRGEHKAVTSCFTIEELSYVILMKLIEKKYDKHPHEVLREKKSSILEFVEDIRKIFSTIYSIDNIEILGSDKMQVWAIPQIMEECFLRPRDGVHLQTMRDCKIDHIVSTDSDFDGIKGLVRLKPETM